MADEPSQPDRYTAAVECGPYVRRADLAGPREPDVTRCAFAALAGLVDDPAVDVDALAPFLLVTVEQTGQMWVYPVEVFLANLAGRRGDQARARRALERLAPPSAEG